MPHDCAVMYCAPCMEYEYALDFVTDTTQTLEWPSHKQSFSPDCTPAVLANVQAVQGVPTTAQSLENVQRLGVLRRPVW